MADVIINEVEKYIISLDIDDSIKNDILEAFKTYSSIIKKFYDNAYIKNPKIAKDYLDYKIEEFKNKLQIFLMAENNSLEYIEYVLCNMELFDPNNLSSLKRSERERMEYLYNKIVSQNFMKSFYEEILTHSSKNFEVVNVDLYTLARYMGYSDDADDNYQLSLKEKMKLGYAKTKIPVAIKETVSNVE